MDDIWKRDEPVPTPCVKICVMHPDAKICAGCLRTIDEIMRWSKMDNAERISVMAELPSRAPLLKKRRGGRSARQDRDQ